MLRENLNEALKGAMKAKNRRAVSTLRLILAAIKDRDISARGKGNAEGISEDDILSVLQTMVRQRQESIKLYREGGADIADMGKGEGDDLPGIGRIGQYFLIAGDRCVEAHLAHRGAGGADPETPVYRAVVQHQRRGGAVGLARQLRGGAVRH